MPLVGSELLKFESDVLLWKQDIFVIMSKIYRTNTMNEDNIFIYSPAVTE